MATYNRIQNIVSSFGLDNDYAYVIYETHRDNCCCSTKEQWAALQRNLKAVGLKATNTAFNAYNQVSARIECEKNNEKFQAFYG